MRGRFGQFELPPCEVCDELLMPDPIKCSSCNRLMHPTEVLTRDLFSDSLGRCKSCVEKDARKVEADAE